jgi:amino acid transporter
MDHEKPEAVLPQVFEYGADQSRSRFDSDFQNVQTLTGTRTPSVDEPEFVEDAQGRRGNGVWYGVYSKVSYWI